MFTQCDTMHCIVNNSLGIRLSRTQLTRDVEPILLQCWAIVGDDRSTLNQHCFNIPCLLREYIQSSSDWSRWLSTNPKPTIYRNLYETTGPGDVFILDPVICIKKQSIDYNTITWGSYTENVQHLTIISPMSRVFWVRQHTDVYRPDI